LNYNRRRGGRGCGAEALCVNLVFSSSFLVQGLDLLSWWGRTDPSPGTSCSRASSASFITWWSTGLRRRYAPHSRRDAQLQGDRNETLEGVSDSHNLTGSTAQRICRWMLLWLDLFLPGPCWLISWPDHINLYLSYLTAGETPQDTHTHTHTQDNHTQDTHTLALSNHPQDTQSLDQSSLHVDLFVTNSFTNEPELGY